MYWKYERLEPVKYVAAKSTEFICVHSGKIVIIITFFHAGIKLPVTSQFVCVQPPLVPHHPLYLCNYYSLLQHISFILRL